MKAARFLRRYSTPPTHFANPGAVPPSFDQLKTGQPQDHNPGANSGAYNGDHSGANSANSGYSSDHAGSDRPLREITTLIAMFSLGYIALDNYINRIKLEKLNNESNAINLKTLQIQQANFHNARKKRDLQILQERKDNDKRRFKMMLHLAMLRKQLLDNGLDPVDIDQALKEFEASVKVDNSIKNVTGQVLWLEDDSRMYLLEDSTNFSVEAVFAQSP